ncbi:MAG TPA: glycosyltransferase family 39 protein [Nitrospirota bacterium]|nr:glycosyltransferase family 39 protein [Nitrospirota bacterium]
MKEIMDTSSIQRNTVIAVVLITLWKIYFAATLQLHPDEAYYWLWSRHLDFGYFDHAPLIAYVIRLTTLFSQQELWVRFGGILAAVIGSVLAWNLSLQMFGDKKIASASVIALNVMPIVMSGYILITPDVPVFFFTGLSIYWFWQIVETQKVRYWYLMGIAFGLTLLSKYTAVLLAPSFFLFMVFSDERRWFKTIHPYAAFLLGCALFLPVVYWNSTHQWISFLYQTRHGLRSEHSPVIKNLLEYAGGQMLVAGPLFWLPGIYASVRSLFQKDKRLLFLSLTSLPIILFFAVSSIQRTAAANWPNLAYFSFGILATQFFFSGHQIKKRLFWIAIIFSVFLSLIASLHARFSILPLQSISDKAARSDATNWFYGWKELAEELEKDPSIKFAMTEGCQIGPEISYYTRERIFVCVDYKRTLTNQYNYWPFPDELRDKNGVDAYPGGSNVPPYKEYFVSGGRATSFTARRNGFPIRTVNLIYGSGYKYPVAPDQLVLE